MRFTSRPVRAAATLLPLAAAFASAQNSSSSLPIVDLGYQLQQASGFNETAAYYNFSNIRYAAPPVADLRFRAPVSPVTDRSSVQDGSELRICHQANPAWAAIAAEWLPGYLVAGILPNVSATGTTATTGTANITTLPGETEDCLFLDVVVPEKIFERAGNASGAPVIVWIHGGGYTSGSKISYGDPAGLIARSQTGSSDGVVYVSINYRLGAFGWLSGPTYQKDATANLGLYDQRFALEWVQKNIHLFGGDKNRVTVVGESAGAGSIMHQITAFGGSAPSLFQQAVPQSPAWLQLSSPYEQEQSFQKYLKFLNVTSLAEARDLTEEQLFLGNVALIGTSVYSSFTVGPSVDGSIVPQDPKYLLNHGQFDKSVRIFSGHTTNEGILFTPPLTNETEFTAFLSAALPNAKPAVISYITETLYPPVYDGSYGYTDLISRLAFALQESSITCNANALDRAFTDLGNDTYAYVFGVDYGVHGQDNPYTFYTPGVPDATGGLVSLDSANETVAFALQDYITSFAIDGVPESGVQGVLAEVPVYGEDGSVVKLTSSGVSVAKDPAANERCRWWQLGLYN
ncbi:carboxylesterase family protein [Diplodia corticola]|uniref:Carboxylic ester hydrolase n=1 Tax=Diplodia corticola TaxID=236234 RepID=A0A1J9RHX2_9PEZI|nr:carboxylesterase family protein [Diplodia corticola]OJD32155.1 carboxylesterase family protein [Diplodia corticola]